MRLNGINISLIFIIFYGITPFLYINILYFGKSELAESTLYGLIYSFVTVIAILLVNKFRFLHFGKLSNKYWLSDKEAKLIFPYVFILCSISFYFNPWNENRTGLYASISALFRIIWVIVSIPLLRTNKYRMIMLLSVILMFIDGSRTFVFIIFLYFIINNFVKKSFILIGFALVLLAASFRNGFYSFDLLYGFFGEGVNGSSGIFQVMQVKNNLIQFPYFLHLIFTFFQPVLIIFSFFIPKNLIDFDSSQFLSGAIFNDLGETYYPMGGFYILSEFVCYGYWGILLFLIYYFVSIKITNALLDTEHIVFSPALIFMLIKSSPHTYWNWIIWFCIIQFVIKFIFKLLIHSNKKMI